MLRVTFRCPQGPFRPGDTGLSSVTVQTIKRFGAVGHNLSDYVPSELREVAHKEGQSAIPLIAKNPELSALAEAAARTVPTEHVVYLGDARDMSAVPNESVHLVVTSPPYWNLKPYESGEQQLGLITDYTDFNDQLARVWAECFRVLTPGGRLVVVVGDVLLPRRV